MHKWGHLSEVQGTKNQTDSACQAKKTVAGALVVCGVDAEWTCSGVQTDMLAITRACV